MKIKYAKSVNAFFPTITSNKLLEKVTLCFHFKITSDLIVGNENNSLLKWQCMKSKNKASSIMMSLIFILLSAILLTCFFICFCNRVLKNYIHKILYVAKD